ncbi:uncharacterized protein LOC132053679 [Lycium ferocissimum]|uniref:uncharacterized protein LOC132053679 n=1 Tax=Lycium ferocissimum TaxID=112874 RepID=UPI00281529A6|nr:uncharacterized protein LOC132053679 [Lycium ferocissimum]
MESWDISNVVSPHLSDLLDDEDQELEEIRREQDEKERMALCHITGKYILMYCEKYLCKEPCRTSMRSGNEFIQEILRGNETRCYENFRMKKAVFIDLSNDLTIKYGLKPTRGMSIHEMLGIFLMTCAHGVGNRMIQDIFQHSGETIHRHFHSVLKAVCKLARDIIQPHPNYNDGCDAHKPCKQRYLPFFKDCIGAIDGTHVKARLPQGQEIPYIRRKGYPTQNILAVVDFNMCFTFAWAGWEGAAHDSRIFAEALRRQELNFPHPRGNKYYLVDAGYSHMNGYMAPYKENNVRYHLAEFHRGATRQLRKPRGHIEKFNYLHSSSRNVVERTFAVWKARWSILRDIPYYQIDTQRNIVLATMAIHNYIRKKCNVDDAFQTAENESYIPSVDSNDIDTTSRANNVDVEDVGEQNDVYWMGFRDMIASDISNA